MDAAQWPQNQVAGLARTMEEIQAPNSNNNNNNHPTNSSRSSPMLERRARPQKDQNVNCPRCNSTNTKFCYYNNYSLTQPRYFCKTCRRYWTQGGSLRNVPVGGGSRKNKRSSSSSSQSILGSSSSTTPSSTSTMMPTNKLIPDLNPPSSLSHLITASHQNPKFLEGQDLNLAFPIQGIFQPLDHQLPKIEGNNNSNNNNNNNENHEPINMNNGNIIPTTTTTTTAPLSALELLRTGMASRGGLNSFVPIPMPDSNTLYPSGFPNLQEFKQNMGVFPSSGSGEHHNNGSDGNMIGSSGSNNVGGARLLFPFADMNKLAASSTTTAQHHDHHDQIDDQSKGGNDHNHHHHQQQQQQHQHHHQGPTGYWTGMLGGGTW